MVNLYQKCSNRRIKEKNIENKFIYLKVIIRFMAFKFCLIDKVKNVKNTFEVSIHNIDLLVKI